MATSIPRGTAKSMFLRLWARAPEDFDLPRARFAARLRQLDSQFAGEVASGQRSRSLQYFVVASGCDHLAAVLPRARAEIENAVGGAHDIGIVLDHQDGISQVAQVVQNLDQAMGIAAVQSDGGLIQHVQRSHQPRPQRSRQLNALRLAAGKSGSQPVQRQVFQPDVIQELQALVDFLQQLVGDGGLLLAQT